MKTAAILPLQVMKDYGYKPYMMALWQAANDSAEYAETFKNRPEGTFLILDNGAAEGENPTPAQLLEVYPRVNPDEIVLPDVVGDRAETVRQSTAALDIFKNEGLPYQIMAVPQGKCFGEWLSCMQYFVKLPGVTTLGISKFVSKLFKDELGEGVNVRLECLQAIIDYCDRMEIPMPQIHLLGCWEDMLELQEIEKAFPGVVRGTDSAIAYVYSRNNMVYTPGLARPDNDEIDFINGPSVNKEILDKNLQAYEDLCK